MDTNQKVIEQLKKIGIKQKAAEVYTALLELKGAHPSRISEYTGLNRSTVYKLLVELSVKGLVSELQKRGKLYYQIENPKRLVKFAENQVQLADERLKNAQKVLPDFLELTKLSPVRPKIRYADGLSGLMSLYESHVLEKEPYEMLGISNTCELTKTFPKKFVSDYIDRKKKLGIAGRAIFPDSEKDKNYLKEFYKNYPKKILPQIRYVPADFFPYKNEITIYGKNKVSIINFKQKDTVGVIIEDQTIHDMMRMIFEMAWTGAR
ncbi:helix-turn-helix domain-containing protein [Candidatus Kuenenbacteria bacterium]|nr:helix-turn-helix domain-containing protein [Candidatus Kuenenbacteria bacterium]